MKELKVLGMAFVISALAASNATASGLYFSQDETGNLYVLNTVTGAATLVSGNATGVVSSTVGLTESANPATLIGSIWSGISLINTDGSGFGVQPNSAAAEGLAYDPNSNTLYGAINGSFFTIEQTTYTQQTILTAPGADIEGLAYGNGGIYGLAGFSGPRGNLYFYNPGLNNWTFIGFTGIEFNLPGLAYDPGANVLYAIGSQDSNLYRINVITGAATVVGNTGITSGSTGGGLAFVAQPVPEPATMGLVGSGVLAAWLRRRRATRGHRV
jgi:hypothetical protein